MTQRIILQHTRTTTSTTTTKLGAPSEAVSLHIKSYVLTVLLRILASLHITLCKQQKQNLKHFKVKVKF